MSKQNKSNPKITINNISKPIATSTLNRSTSRNNSKQQQHSLEDSLSILSLKSVNLSNISQVSFQASRKSPCKDATCNKVAGLPSKYLKSVPGKANDDSSYIFSHESTINDSDLMGIPRNTSTPRNSSPTHRYSDPIQRSAQFTPGEKAGVLLTADEMSWRKRNQLDVTSRSISIQNLSTDESMGEFFSKKSDSISDLRCSCSPQNDKKEPVALVSFTEKNVNESLCGNKSLNHSAIRNMLAESKTSSQILDIICNQSVKQKSSIEPRQAQKQGSCKRTSSTSPRPSMQNQNLKAHESSPRYASCESLTNRSNTSSCLANSSKYSSYTSAHSQNDALKVFERKSINSSGSNNQSVPVPRQISQASSTTSSSSSSNCSNSSASVRASSRASSALTSLSAGKLPIETTVCDLVWGCVRIDKYTTRNFQLRNTSSKRVKIQASISGREFKLRKDDRAGSDTYSTLKIALHPHEIRNMSVSFMPSKIGAAVDAISFTSLDSHLQQTVKQSIKLSGYGGLYKIEFQGLSQDTSNKYWFLLGKLDSGYNITKSFSLKNTGQLPAFACISFISKEYLNVVVSPNFFTLLPQESKEVTVTYKPSIEDLLNFQQNSNVFEIGTLSFIGGSEATRWRLKRMSRRRMEQSGTFDPLVDKLSEKIDGEVMPTDVEKFCESPSCMMELMKALSRREIVVTLERDPDQTIVPQYMEDSAMFQSLLQDTTVVSTNVNLASSIKFEPSVILLKPPTKRTDIIMLKSDWEEDIPYKISTIPSAGLLFNPKQGTLRPGERIIVQVELVSRECKEFKMSASLKQNVIEALVKII